MAAMTSHRLRWIAVAGLALGSLVGCSEGGTLPEPPGTPGLRVVSGGDASDTIGAILPQALIVEVRDAEGYLQPGVSVVFSVVAAGNDAAADDLSVANLSSQQFRGSLSETADSRGRASALVRLGSKAGSAVISVAAPSLGLQTTASLTVRPGAAARIAVAPADSAVLVGGTYDLRGDVQDRMGNLRTDPITFEAGNTATSVMGARLRGERVGRGYVVARAGGLTDTARVSVVPAGVLAAYEFPIYFNSNGPDIRQPGRIVTFNTDGSHFRVVLDQQPATIPSSYAHGMQPAWAPDGGEIAFLNSERLMATSLSGAWRSLFSTVESVNDEYAPQFSPDGEWVYFSVGRHGSQRTFWRVRRDGTDAQQVSPDESWGVEVMPSPDPSGTRVVYQTNRATNSSEFTLRILDVNTGQVSALDVPGSGPRWSPRGDWIAYFGRDGTLRRVRPDGSASQVIGSGTRAHPTFAWSPDGEWLVISGNQPRPGRPFAVGLALVHVATGEVLPLVFNRDLVQPAWRR
jgi:hypothetical protein